jgi:UDP:flavonoid glycosyltransferase YjiC (YdhE family)
MRILFTTVGLSGHLFTLVPLAWAARSSGHEVLVATTDNFVPSVLRAGLPAVSCGPAADFVERGAAAAVTKSLAERRRVHGRVFAGIAAASLPGTESTVRTWCPDVVVSERAEFAGPVAAAAHGVPRVELRWGVAALDEYRAAAAELLRRDLTRLGLTALPEPAEVLNPWPPSLRPVRAGGQRGIRHVPYNGDARVPQWTIAPRAPRDRPRICLTLGTVLPRLGIDGVADLVLGVLTRLARQGFELVVAVADSVAADWSPLPAAVRHAGQVPLAEALRACDGVIHHGGQGTALTALEIGLPQLVLPQFDDQLDNADAVVRSGAGLRMGFDEVTPDSIVESCVDVMETPRFRRAGARVAAEIRAEPAPVELVGLLETVAAGAAGADVA